MLGGVLDEFLKIIQYMCLHFIRASSIDNMLSKFFFELFVLKNLTLPNYCYNYVTYILQVM